MKWNPYIHYGDRALTLFLWLLSTRSQNIQMTVDIVGDTVDKRRYNIHMVYYVFFIRIFIWNAENKFEYD